MELSIRNVDTFVHGEVRVTIRYLGYALVLLHRNYTQHNAHEELDITKCVYSLVPVPCCLKKEDNIDVLKLLL